MSARAASADSTSTTSPRVASAVALWQARERIAATTEIRRQVATMLSGPASRWSELQAALDTTGLDEED